MLLIKVSHQCTLPASVLQLDFSEWSFLLNDAVTHWQVLGNRLTTVAALSLGLAHCTVVCDCAHACPLGRALGPLFSCACAQPYWPRFEVTSPGAQGSCIPASADPPQPCRSASAFLRLSTAPRLEGSSPGAWPLPAIQRLHFLVSSLQAGPSPAPARCRPGPVRPLCMSSAGCLSSQASAASVFARETTSSLGCRSCRAGDVPPATLPDDDIESIFRSSSSEERPAAKARLAGPPPPRPTNGPHGAVADGPAVGEGPACWTAGPPVPTPATSKASGPVVGSGTAADGLPPNFTRGPAAAIRGAQHMATTVTATASAPKASSVIQLPTPPAGLQYYFSITVQTTRVSPSSS